MFNKRGKDEVSQVWLVLVYFFHFHVLIDAQMSCR